MNRRSDDSPSVDDAAIAMIANCMRALFAFS